MKDPKLPRTNLAGRRFGRLSVLNEWDRVGGQTRWRCVCDCGSEPKMIQSSCLLNGQASCGCLMRELRARQATARAAKQLAPEPEEVEPERGPSKRFYLIQRNEFWGIFNAEFGSVQIVSREKSDALIELKRLLRPEKKIYRRGLDEVAEEMVKKAGAA